MVKLMGFQFEIHYRPGLENKAVDGLSRINHTTAFMALTVPRVVQLDQLPREVEADDKVQRIIKDLQTDPTSQPNFQWVGSQLLYKRRLYLPKRLFLIPLILHEGHDGSLGRHSGFLKTYKRVAASVYWQGMKKDIHEYMSSCSVCQQNKYSALKPGGLLQHLPIPNQVWEGYCYGFHLGVTKVGQNGFNIGCSRPTK